MSPSGGPKRGSATEMFVSITVGIPVQDVIKIDEICAQEDYSRSQVIRMLLHKALQGGNK